MSDEHPLRNLTKDDSLPKVFLTPRAGDHWCMAPHARQLAAFGDRSQFTKVGARIIYSVDDVIAYEKTHNPADKP